MKGEGFFETRCSYPYLHRQQQQQQPHIDVADLKVCITAK